MALQESLHNGGRRLIRVDGPLHAYLGFLSVRRIAKLLYGIAVSFVVFEIGILAFNPQREALDRDLVAGDPSLGFRMVANYRGSMPAHAIEGDEGQVALVTNSWGVRERELASRPPGSLRVYVLGDSMIFGMRVEAEDTVTRHLEQRLGEKLKRPVEVINGGIPGYGTTQAFRFFEETASRVAPDLVLLAVTVYNDITDNLKFAALDGTIPEAPGPFQRVRNWVRQRSQVYLLIRRYKGAARADDMMDIHAAEPPPRIERGLRMTEEDISKFARAAGARGIAFAVLLVPAQKQVYPQVWGELLNKYGLSAETHLFTQPNERLALFDQSEGIPTLDLLAPFRNSPDGMYYNEHWTVGGHQFVADQLAEFLLSRGLLK